MAALKTAHRNAGGFAAFHVATANPKRMAKEWVVVNDLSGAAYRHAS